MRGDSCFCRHNIPTRLQRRMKDGVEQAAAGGVSVVEARLHPVAQGHQLIDLGDNAVLLGEGSLAMASMAALIALTW